MGLVKQDVLAGDTNDETNVGVRTELRYFNDKSSYEDDVLAGGNKVCVLPKG